MIACGEKCTGCGVCSISCPKQCISMEPNAEGFRNPIVDIHSCIDCRLCEKVCLVEKDKHSNNQVSILAVKNKDVEIRMKSSSGGFFREIAMLVLQKGGVVCGAAFNNRFEVIHQFAENESEVSAFFGAKYAQSIAEPCFPKIKEYLSLGRDVLFVGTPCQTAGLRSYLGKDYAQLLLVDTICHGVPSPKVWEKYLQERRYQDAKGAGVSSVNHRDKVSGWSKQSYSVRIQYANGKAYLSRQSDDWFMRGFVYNVFLRPSCSQCDFKGNNHASDITLGDYWGVWDQYPDFDDNKGVSLIMFHTEKGNAVWNEIRDRFDYMEVDAQKAFEKNRSALESSVPHPKRGEFFEKVFSSDYTVAKAVQETMFGVEERITLLQRIKRKIRKCIRE